VGRLFGQQFIELTAGGFCYCVKGKQTTANIASVSQSLNDIFIDSKPSARGRTKPAVRYERSWDEGTPAHFKTSFRTAANARRSAQLRLRCLRRL